MAASPLPGLVLSWRHLSYSVKLKDGKTKNILTDLSGTAQPGQILGIMGASGGGKTSFLSALTQRLPKDAYTGSLTANGQRIGPWTKALQGYVSQDVPFLAHLTTLESMMFAARLKLPQSMPRKEKRAKVDELLALMDLSQCGKTRVGNGIDPGGLSGGERRRLALAIELLSDPCLLIADEVLSGLDSASALRITLILKKLARERNCTVILSLHQPRADLLPLLDQLFILSQGKTIYFGPSFRNTPGDEPFLSFFSDAGYPLPSFVCPTDAVIDLVNSGDDAEGLIEDAQGNGAATAAAPAATGATVVPPVPDAAAAAAVVVAPDESAPAAVVVVANPAVDAAATGEELDNAPPPPSSPTKLIAASSSSLVLRGLAASKRVGGKTRQQTIDELVEFFAASPLAAATLVDPPSYPTLPSRKHRQEGKYATPWLNQVLVLLERTFIAKLRNPDAVASVFMGTVITAIIVGSVFYKLPLTFSGARDRFSAIAFLVLTMSFSCFDQVVLFPSERHIMLRENAAGSYSVSAFYIGRTLAELPVQLAFSIVVSLISWSMFGLQPGTLGPYLVLITLATLVGASLLTLAGALSNSLAMGNSLASVFLVFSSLFNSFFISSENIPAVWRWIQDISFPAFAVRGCVFVDLSTLTYNCTPDEIAAGCNGQGSQILAAAGMQSVDWRMMALYLIIEFIVFRILSFFCLHFLWTGQSFKTRLKAFFA